ncbi:MAG: hypothetical protein A2511_16870 [Deltaproteobacteria bacterium RIFOXYD12_FULL_50_9]|nr:MAG: hypothetical protein A2511_16870 [Deltaproteobacteria bacterium RIFOXYD12_FULL_50_9]
MLTAKDIMTKEVLTVPMDMQVEELAAIFCHKKISGVPVLNASGDLFGVVTENDLIDQTKKLHIPTVITILDSVIFLEKPGKFEQEIKKMAGQTVQDICTRNPITVNTDTPIEELASIMADNNMHTLPVLEYGRLVGVVGKTDIIRTLIRHGD